MVEDLEKVMYSVGYGKLLHVCLVSVYRCNMELKECKHKQMVMPWKRRWGRGEICRVDKRRDRGGWGVMNNGERGKGRRKKSGRGRMVTGDEFKRREEGGR